MVELTQKMGRVNREGEWLYVGECGYLRRIIATQGRVFCWERGRAQPLEGAAPIEWQENVEQTIKS